MGVTLGLKLELNKLFVAVLGSALLACSVHVERAALPADWQGVSSQQLAVSGYGDWARLRGQPLRIGDYVTGKLDYSLWATAPTISRSSVSSGDDGIQLGSVDDDNDSGYGFSLYRADVALAAVRCRQYRRGRGWYLRVADEGSQQALELQGDERFVAGLSCSAEGLTQGWLPWQLELRATSRQPFAGLIHRGGSALAVVGSRQGLSVELPETVSIAIRDGGHSVAMLDLLNGGALHLHPRLQQELEPAVVAAAMALLLANDPLAED